MSVLVCVRVGVCVDVCVGVMLTLEYLAWNSAGLKPRGVAGVNQRKICCFFRLILTLSAHSSRATVHTLPVSLLRALSPRWVWWPASRLTETPLFSVCSNRKSELALSSVTVDPVCVCVCVCVCVTALFTIIGVCVSTLRDDQPPTRTLNASLCMASRLHTECLPTP